MGLLSSKRPGVFTAPTTATLTLCTSRTITETSGDGRYTARRSVNCARSSPGVRPAAWMSLTSGSDILPSGRTGIVRQSSGQFFHTRMSSRSSGPIRKSAAALKPRSSGLTGVGIAAAGITGTGAITAALADAGVLSAGADVGSWANTIVATNRLMTAKANGRTVIAILPSLGPPPQAAESNDSDAARP